MFLFWLYRASRHAHEQGVEGRKLSPAWAVWPRLILSALFSRKFEAVVARLGVGSGQALRVSLYAIAVTGTLTLAAPCLSPS